MNYKLFFLACALNLFYYVPNLLASPIIGGQEDTDHKYKYHVTIRDSHDPSIENSGQFLCGGAIIGERYVLSAAHPFLRMDGREIAQAYYPRIHGIIVVSGTSETYGQGIITQVDKIFIPLEYNEKFYADISVLKLEDNLNVKRYSAILDILPIDQTRSLNFFVNKDAVILGNGYDTFENGHVVEKVADKRHSLVVRMLPKIECPQFDYAICARNIDTSCIRTCHQGDSGSPIIFNNAAIGVVSVGSRNLHHRTPIKCTRTWTFRYFIRNAMRQHGDYSQMHILEN